MDVRDAEANGNHRDLAERCSGIGLLRVSTRSSPNSVAGAMAGVVRERGSVSVQVVGAGALNQAIKAVAIARSFVEGSDIDLVCVPSFADIEIDGEARTAIRLVVEDRARTRARGDASLEAPPPAVAVVPGATV